MHVRYHHVTTGVFHYLLVLKINYLSSRLLDSYKLKWRLLIAYIKFTSWKWLHVIYEHPRVTASATTFVHGEYILKAH